MVIGIDIDDTITDTYEVMMNYAQEYTINNLKREPLLNEKRECSNHAYAKYLSGWNDEEEYTFLEKYYEKIIKNVKPKTLAIEYLNKLKKDGHKIVLITARWGTDFFDTRKLTEDWLAKNNVPYDKLIINVSEKLVAAKEENIDVFIDDSFKNCKDVSNGGIKTYIMDSRTNYGIQDDNIKRIFSWPHFYMEIENIK